MKNELIKIIGEILKVSPEKLEGSISNKDIWDSLLDIRFEEEELPKISSPEDLINLALKKEN